MFVPRVISSAILVLFFSSRVSADCTTCYCPEPVVDCRRVCDVCACDVANGVIDCRVRSLKSSFSTDLEIWPTGTFTELLLDHNRIGRIVPFPTLKIKKLSIQGNNIESIDHRAFYNLTSLKSLDLSHNQLTSVILVPEVFEGPYSSTYYEPENLEILNLAYNELTQLHRDLFEHLPYLKQLNLAGNRLGDENGNMKASTAGALAGVPHIQVLDLSENSLSKLPTSIMANLVNIKELILSNNKFETFPGDQLSFAGSLQTLRLDSNPIKIISKTPSVPSLSILSINTMPLLKRIESKALAGFTGLRRLYCSHNPMLEFISSDALASSNITRLELQENNLRYLPNSLVPNWNNVKYIDVRGNQWSCDCENQWMVTSLVPLLGNNSDGLLCSNPEPMKGSSFDQLFERNYQMRCLDYYGNRPDRDASYLIATFIIVIVALVIIGAVMLYKGGRCRKGKPIDYTAIYQQHVTEDYDPKF